MRLVTEIATFYLISCFSFWFLDKVRDKKNWSDDISMAKSFTECLYPNKINIILTLSGYGIWYAFSTLVYLPITDVLLPPIPSGIEVSYPYSLTVIRLLFDLLNFYLIGSFALWLVHFFKE